MRRWHAFISYSSADADFVEGVRERLKESGITLWFDREEILVGESIIRKIKEGIDESLLIILFISDSWLASGWCQREMELMEHREVSEEQTFILPFLVGDVKLERLSGFLRTRRIERLNPSDIDKSADLVRHGVESHLRRFGDYVPTSVRNSLHPLLGHTEEPLFLCIDIPTGINLEGAPSFLHSPPEDYAEQVGAVAQAVMFPILDAVSKWWLHNMIGFWRKEDEEQTARDALITHVSQKTGFYLVEKDSAGEINHPLQEHLIWFLVLHSCKRADAAMLDSLKFAVIQAHVNRDLEVVRENISVQLAPTAEECMPSTIALAATIFLYSKKKRDPDAPFRIDWQ